MNFKVALLALLPLGTLLAGTAKGDEVTGDVTETVTYEWTVRRKWQNPDGFYRPVLTINGAPVGVGDIKIRVKNGGRVIVNLINDANQPITIHFHGIHQKGTPWMDGVGTGTQCAIPAGTSFQYDFVVNQSPGTYMWHGHYLGTEADGLHGPFIIDPAEDDDPMYADLPKEEIIVEMADWYHVEASLSVEGLAAVPEREADNVGTPPHWPGNPQTLLINGKGKWPCTRSNIRGEWEMTGANDAFGVTYCDPDTRFEIGGTEEVINVQPGKRYYMRLINLAVVQYMTVTIENHNLTVVAADGHPVKPFTVASLDINVAERYDVILETTGNPGETYKFKVGTKFRASFSGQYNPAAPGPIQVANLTYGSDTGAAELDSPLTAYNMTPEDRTAGFNTSAPGGIDLDYFNVSWVKSLNPLPEDMNGEPDQTLVFDGYNLINDGEHKPTAGQLVWPINNNPYKEDPSGIPILPLIATNLGDPSLHTEDNSVWTLPKGSVTDIVMHNFPESWEAVLGQIDMHPWHLHGFSFYVMGFGPGEYPGFQAALEAGMLNTEDPPYRDMVTSFPGIMPDGSDGVNMIEAPEITKTPEPEGMLDVFTGGTSDCVIDDPRPNCQMLVDNPRGWSLIRLKADNPGVWNIHCHLIWHQVMAMQGFIVIAPDEIPPMPEQYARDLRMQCAALGANTDLLDEVLFAAGHEDLVGTTPGEGSTAPPASAPVDATSPTPEATTPTPEAASPTPEATSPTPEATSPTPDASSPTPDATSPTPDATSPTPPDATESPTESPTLSAALSVRGTLPITAVASLFVAIAGAVVI